MGFIAIGCCVAGALLIAALCELAPVMDEDEPMSMTARYEQDYIVHHYARCGAHMVYHFRRDQLADVGRIIICQFRDGLLSDKDVDELRVALEEIQLLEPRGVSKEAVLKACEGK